MHNDRRLECSQLAVKTSYFPGKLPIDVNMDDVNMDELPLADFKEESPPPIPPRCS